MAEENIHQDSQATVTTARVIVQGTTYPLRNISSVRLAILPVYSSGATSMIVFGALILIVCFVIWWDTSQLPFAWLLAAALLICSGIVWIRSLRPWFCVVISSTGGEVRALSSKDGQYIGRIVEAINQAVVQYR